MIVAIFSAAEAIRKGRKVATPNPADALASSGPTPLPRAGDRHGPSLAASAHVDLGRAVGIAGEAHFVTRQFRQAGQSRTSFREQVFHRHRLKMGVPDAGGTVL